MHSNLIRMEAAMHNPRAVEEATKSVDIAEKIIEVSRRILQANVSDSNKSAEEAAANEIIRKMEPAAR